MSDLFSPKLLQIGHDFPTLPVRAGAAPFRVPRGSSIIAVRSCRHVPVVVLVAMLLSSCAARPHAVSTAPDPAPDPRELPALIEQGCHACLVTAYDRSVARGAADTAFEAATLLVLRSKELGLPSAEWLARARALAASDAAAAYLDIVDVIPQDRLSADREGLFDLRRRAKAKASIERWRATLQTGPHSAAFRAYLDVSLVCSFGRLSEDARSYSGTLDPVVLTPLYRFAIGHCDSSQRARMTSLRDDVPAFVDAEYALARYALEDPVAPDPEDALRRLHAAAAAFPESPAVPIWIGNIHRAWEEWAPAVDAFDRALAVAPDHPDALVGRAVSLSQLGRSDEAIAAATRVIDIGQWQLGEAYYWRAWNRLRLDQLDDARRDVDRARSLMSNSRVFVLSGVIEWRLKQLTAAAHNFEQALTMDFGECEAAFNLGVVRDELGRQRDAFGAFKQAGQCNDLSIALREEAIAKVRAGTGTDTAKAREVGRHERTLKDLKERREEVTRALTALERYQESR